MHGLIAPAVDHRLKNDRYADVDGSVIGGHAAGYAEADAVCGAPYGESSPERTNTRNGCRHREFDTRIGTLDVAIPKLREGSYFPDWLLERRRRAERALTTEVATAPARRQHAADGEARRRPRDHPTVEVAGQRDGC